MKKPLKRARSQENEPIKFILKNKACFEVCDKKVANFLKKQKKVFSFF